MRGVWMALLSAALLAGCARQLTPDERRVEDVHTIAAVIEEFHAKTGGYPLAERIRNEPIKVSITAARQTLFGAITTADLEKVLQAKLGREVKLPTDPGTDPWRKMIGYEYRTDGRDYAVAAYLQKPNGYTRAMGPKINIYEIGSVEIVQSKIWNYRKMKDGAYAALAEPIPAQP